MTGQGPWLRADAGKRGCSIPFNRPALVGTESMYVQEAIDNGQFSGDGPLTAKCHRVLREVLGAAHALLTTTCTHALEMTALLLDLGPGDEVILPSFAFVSTVNAYVLRGAAPVFADIRPDTLNIDDRLIESKITSRTKAIVCLHYAGVGCEMDEIMRIASRAGIPVIEDNAHGLFGKYRGRFLGTFGCMATQSFHETKNISCGEGGALIVNDSSLIERAEVMRQKGTNRNRFLRGQVDKYSWVDLGSSYPLSDLLAAFLYAQLEARDRIQAAREHCWKRYDAELHPWAARQGIRTPHIPGNCEQPYHMYYLVMLDADMRTAFIRHMAAHDILTVFHYQPLHISPMGKRFGGKPGDCPVTESVSERLVRLPLFNDMSESEQAAVIESILQFS
jgi:dTDP-4-amino-4,6-dideoxygalactose transaminase